MPVLDESVYIEKRAGSSQAALFTDKPSQPSSSITPDKLPNGVDKPPTVSLIDLVDLSSDDAPVPSSSTSDFLQDLLGVDLTNPPSSGHNYAYLSTNNQLDMRAGAQLKILRNGSSYNWSPSE